MRYSDSAGFVQAGSPCSTEPDGRRGDALDGIRRLLSAGAGDVQEDVMFDREQFMADCRAAVAAGDGQKAVRELVERAVADPARVVADLGEPQRAGVTPIYRAADLTILNFIWGPMMTLAPHNHNLWAVIGIYTGCEDNIFWRRLPGDGASRVEAAGAKALCAGDAAPLGRDIIHSVTNPLGRLTGAIHVYGGDFFATPRSEWNRETLTEGPGDVARNMQLFAESNRLYGLA
jgi:predicted metal-dependent enzyme (double-stranded beta helix superfamily)